MGRRGLKGGGAEMQETEGLHTQPANDMRSHALPLARSRQSTNEYILMFKNRY
jgi:hypothetical protein